MASFGMITVIFAASLCGVLVAGTGVQSKAGMEMQMRNPIRKIVTMLQDMGHSLEQEGDKEKQLFEQFLCYCKEGSSKLAASVEAGKASAEQLAAKVEQDEAAKSQLIQDLAGHKTDRATAEKTLSESSAMRGKEAAEFAAASGEMKSNVQAMGSALEALKKGLSASLLQTGVGRMITNIIQNSPAVDESMRGILLSQLQGGEEVEGGSDQIIGIVSQMRDTMAADLKEAIATEEEAKAAYATLTSSKTKELAAANSAIEQKTARVGELGVEIVQGQADLEGTEEAVVEDSKMLANLHKQCETRKQEFDEKSKVRAEEMTAISETVEMLSGDEALELFKKSLPGPAASFLQTRATSRSQVRRARAMLEGVAAKSGVHTSLVRMMLLALGHSHKGRSGGAMDKVVSMIDDMVKLLKKEQSDDDTKKDFCVAELGKLEDEEKAIGSAIADLDAEIEEASDSVAQTASEIDTVKQGLAALDRSVAEATEQRKSEHAEFTQSAASNQAALDLLGMAKNRMNKFYAPAAYVAPPATPGAALLEETPALVQVSQARARRSSGGGVIQLMDQMMKDVELDMQAAKSDEGEAQVDYEEAMKDAATKRSDDSKLIVTKEGEKSDLTSKLEDLKEARMTKGSQLNIAKETLLDTHKTCDALLDNYDARKEARTAESEGLSQSKAVLAGASVGFL